MDAFLNSHKKTVHQSAHFLPGTVTCVYGRPGIGKTHFVTHELGSHVHLDHQVLKGKQTTLDFFERLRYTSSPVLIDNWESVCDLIGIREIKGPVSKGPLVIIAHTPVELFDNMIMYEMPIMKPEEIAALAPDHPGALQIAQSCKGDVRTFLRSLKHASDKPDAFKTPREIVVDLLSSKIPSEYLTKTLHEHGYVWAMVQENYVDTKGLTMDTCASIAESFSLADVYDQKIYSDGMWDNLMPYFVLTGCVTPCALMNQKLSTLKLRSGSMWTKFQNMRMRLKRIQETRMSHDALCILRLYVEHGEFDLLDYYKMNASAIDAMNHIVIGQKLKPRLVENAKKHVRARDAT
jgi:hypothetical protein